MIRNYCALPWETLYLYSLLENQVYNNNDRHNNHNRLTFCLFTFPNSMKMILLTGINSCRGASESLSLSKFRPQPNSTVWTTTTAIAEYRYFITCYFFFPFCLRSVFIEFTAITSSSDLPIVIRYIECVQCYYCLLRSLCVWGTKKYTQQWTTVNTKQAASNAK